MGLVHYRNARLKAERDLKTQDERINKAEKEVEKLKEWLRTAKFQRDKLVTVKLVAEDQELAAQRDVIQRAAHQLMAGATKEAVMEEFQLDEDLYSAAHQEVRYRKGEF